jgi:hypothetical protein
MLNGSICEIGLFRMNLLKFQKIPANFVLKKSQTHQI